MKLSLIIDGNYLLHRNTFSLHRDNILYGSLYDSLIKTVENYNRWYPFDNIYFISDVKSNWRKRIYPDYKSHRQRTSDIDWDFVHSTFEEVKQHFRETKHIKVLEGEEVEGDDWFYYLSVIHNKKNESVLIVSADSDLKQLVRMSSKSPYFNLMVNENLRRNTVSLPEGYQTWLSRFSQQTDLPDLFDSSVSRDTELHTFIKKLINERQIESVDSSGILFEKIITGDKSDNIKSIWITEFKSGAKRGIGPAGAKKLYIKYKELFGRPDFKEECLERISDFIVEEKELGDTEFSKIVDNITLNNKLINMNKIPKSIIQKMKKEHDRV